MGGECHSLLCTYEKHADQPQDGFLQLELHSHIRRGHGCHRCRQCTTQRQGDCPRVTHYRCWCLSTIALAAVVVSLRLQTPVRISSVARGDKFRAGAYSIVEDIMAVDGGYGQKFR